ncbi:MAG: flagellar hook-associated protein FlgK [Acetobacterales bacterium]
MSLNIALTTAVSGMNAAQTALQTISSNVTNVNTDGYSRKITTQTTRIVGTTGQGVQIADIRREVDLFLQRSLNIEVGALGAVKTLDSYYSRMQDLFGTPDSNQSISALINQLGNAFEALSVDPDKAAPQLEVVELADKIARKLQELTSSIQDMRFEVDRQIADGVAAINGHLQSISDLNEDIIPLIRAGAPVGDLLDARDRELKALSELIDVKTFIRENGELVVYTGGGNVLVDGKPTTMFHDPMAFADPDITYDAGNPVSGGIKGIFVRDAGVAANDITGDIDTGRLSALIQLRDQDLVNLQDQMEQLASTLVEQINTVHNKGAGFPPAQTLTGSNDVFTAPTTDTLTAGAGGYGSIRIAVTDQNGVVDGAALDLDLDNLRTQLEAEGIIAAAGPLTVAHVVNAINGEYAVGGAQELTTGTPVDGLPQVVDVATGNLSGDFAAVQNGALVLSVSGGFGIAMDELDSAIGDGGTDRGFSYFFGLNDFFTVDPDGSDNVAGTIAVNQRLLAQPSEVSRGMLRATSDGTSYELTPGDDTVVRQIADKFDEQIAFPSAGGLAAVNATLENFGVAILSANANRAALVSDQAEFQQILTSDLQNRYDSVSAVNLDEELANMLIYQNAFSASARVIQTAQQLFDVLSSLIR